LTKVDTTAASCLPQRGAPPRCRGRARRRRSRARRCTCSLGCRGRPGARGGQGLGTHVGDNAHACPCVRSPSSVPATSQTSP
jgi:hypothetical protein